MCDPVTAMVGLSLAGTAVSAAGQISQGNQAEAMGRLQQASYEQQARSVANASAFEQARERRKFEVTQANARAQIGSSGVALEGSPGEVLMNNAGESELDIAAIQYGSTIKQDQLRTQGAISAFGGQQARSASRIAATGTLLSGIGRSVQMGGSPFARTSSGGTGFSLTNHTGLY